MLVRVGSCEGLASQPAPDTGGVLDVLLPEQATKNALLRQDLVARDAQDIDGRAQEVQPRREMDGPGQQDEAQAHVHGIPGDSVDPAGDQRRPGDFWGDREHGAQSRA